MAANKIRKTLDRWIESSWGGALVAGLSVIVGLLTDYPSVLVALLIVTLLLLVYRERVVHERQDKFDDVITTKLQNAASPALLAKFDDIYSTFRSRLSRLNALEAEQRTAEVDTLIDECLRSIVALTDEFRSPDEPARIAANIMLYRSVDAIHESGDSETVLSRLRFMDNPSLTPLLGILEIQSSLSCATAKGRRVETPDAELEIFCMPVPKEVRTKRKGRKLCLPGGPEAFEYGHSIIDDTVDFMGKLGDYSIGQDTSEEILEYFQTTRGKLVRSMVCFCIGSRAGKLGVINIHADQANYFPRQGVVPALRGVIGPFILDLGELLELRHIQHNALEAEGK